MKNDIYKGIYTGYTKKDLIEIRILYTTLGIIIGVIIGILI